MLCALLAGCAQPAVVVPVADDAANPLCARVVLALPDELAGLERRTTSSQATRAWGDEDPIVLRCGVVVPGPTTDSCVSAGSTPETSVDWITRTETREGDAPGAESWVFTTYGRDPAVEVVVPASITAARSTSFLVDLNPAVTHVEATRTCL